MNPIVKVICDSTTHAFTGTRLITMEVAWLPPTVHSIHCEIHTYSGRWLVSATEVGWGMVADSCEDWPRLQAAIRLALGGSVPRVRERGDWHLPYVDDNVIEEVALHVFDEKDDGTGLHVEDLSTAVIELVRRISVVCCDRVEAYPSMTDGALRRHLLHYDRLVASRYLGPCAHQATPDFKISKDAWAHPQYHGTFYGWQQFRKMFVGELQSLDLPNTKEHVCHG